ncbi:MAG: primosomal protein N', partial [Curvibacter sp.]
MPHQLPILVQTPALRLVAGTLSYLSEQPLAPGTLVRVPLGRRETLGIVWDPATSPETGLDASRLRPIGTALDALAPLAPAWRRLVDFAATYYQRAAGEVALAALPPQLRELSREQLARRLRRQTAPAEPGTQETPPEATAEQKAVLARLQTEAGPFLLYGATGSGKTEVYLRRVQQLLEHQPDAQALVMVPEINLTPQLEQRFAARFGAEAVVSLHSGMTNPQRLRSWLAAHSGAARIVLGTRMAVFASMPGLRLIVVDEEHDPSYKQQEGARYSARDLAVYRGRLENAQVILGSATPSLESWHHSRPAAEGGRYVRLEMPSRVGDGGAPPLVRRVDMNHQPRHAVFSPPLLQAITERIARGEQSMVFLNRRGYAPVLHCAECDWKSECPHCSAYRVFHKIDRTLRCHHCGHTERVPRACPSCGSPDIRPMGRGTEKLEEQLAELLAGVRRPDGAPVRIVRIDADTTKLKGELEAQLAQVHSGEVDVLVGTQMIAKGHDFRR